MAINSTLVTATGNDIFLCPGTASTDEREYAITCMMFCNYHPTLPVTLDVWLLAPLPASIDNRTLVMTNLTIPANETFTFDTEKIVLATGERIHARANTDSKLTVSVSSMRVS